MEHDEECCRDLAHSMECKTCEECGGPDALCHNGYCEKCAERLGICAHCGNWMNE